MARKVKTEQEKKKSRRKAIIISLVVLLIVALAGFCIWKFVINKGATKVAQPTKILDSLEEFGYNYDLSDRDSAYYKKEYEELKKILTANNVDEKEYATKVARMFTIDLYTLSTKVNMYDVGGSEFYHKDRRTMYEQKVMDTLYSTMLDNTFNDRKQELPEIKEVTTVSVDETTYKLGEADVKAYLVKLEMKYVKDLKYDSEASVVVCEEDSGKWSVVDFQPTLNPKYN